jgi:hypothetical protein
VSEEATKRWFKKRAVGGLVILWLVLFFASQLFGETEVHYKRPVELFIFSVLLLGALGALASFVLPLFRCDNCGKWFFPKASGPNFGRCSQCRLPV